MSAAESRAPTPAPEDRRFYRVECDEVLLAEALRALRYPADNDRLESRWTSLSTYWLESPVTRDVTDIFNLLDSVPKGSATMNTPLIAAIRSP
jgi:hypothetical protein